MSDPFDLGVLYRDHPSLAAGTPLASLWSYESCAASVRSRRSLDRPHQYWLHRSDPLLNTMLPGTHVSVVVNLADPWATGRSLPSSSLLPAVSVIGPFTWPQFLRVGRRVRAIGAVLPSAFSGDIFGVPAPALVNQIVPRAELQQAALAMAAKITKKSLFALKLTKEAVNAAEDVQGRAQAMHTSFSLHQLAHTHWLALYGKLMDPTGLPPETARAIGHRTGKESS